MAVSIIVMQRHSVVQMETSPAVLLVFAAVRLAFAAQQVISVALAAKVAVIRSSESINSNPYNSHCLSNKKRHKVCGR